MSQNFVAVFHLHLEKAIGQRFFDHRLNLYCILFRHTLLRLKGRYGHEKSERISEILVRNLRSPLLLDVKDISEIHPLPPLLRVDC